MASSFFLFDLDGTVTREELLPALAREIGLGREMAELTRLTMQGAVDFVSSFSLRFALLRGISLERVHACFSQVALDPDIVAFIHDNTERCAIATGNLDLWVAPLLARLHCAAYTSVARARPEGLELASVLDKGDLVRRLRCAGRRIIAIGDGANDMAMFEEADVGIAFAGVHEPMQALQRRAAYVVRDGKALCALLSTL